jgi:two-component system cell cycle sensor histidine kinase/response regulator CckA
LHFDSKLDIFLIPSGQNNIRGLNVGSVQDAVSIVNHGTVLVVDDEEPVRRMAKLVLQRAGYTVLLASSAPEAIKTLGRTRVDAVLTDLVMPEMSGQELVRQVRRNWPDIGLCCMSAFTDEVPPGVEFLPKPFGTLQLLTCIRTAIQAGEKQHDRNGLASDEGPP